MTATPSPELPDLDREILRTHARRVFEQRHDVDDDAMDELIAYVLTALARRAQPEGETPHSQFDASKGIYWFSVLLKCARLLDLPDDEPIPSGVLKAVEALVAQPAAQHAESGAQAAILTGEQLYTMVTSRFKSGSFPWSMVADSGKAAWNAAASDLTFAPDTIGAALAAQSQVAQAATCKLHAPVVRGALVSYKALARSLGLSAHRDDYTKASLALSEVDRYIAALAAKAEAPAQRTELSKRIREAATADVTEKQARLLIGAAEEIERAQQAAAPGALDWINDVVRDVCELPDRDSPAGREDMMLVTVNELHDIIARHAPSAPGTPEAPADPLDTILPCDIKVGNVNIRKGCKLRTLVVRMESLHRMAVAALPKVTPEQRAEFDSMFPRAAQLDGGQGEGK